jgi:hypothetical protein
MDHHLAAVSDGVAFDPERLARSFEAVRRASEPFSYPADTPVMIAPIVFGPGPAERLMTPLQATVANLQASIQASETARANSVADMKPVANEAFQPVPEWFLFETPTQRRARMIRKFGYAC